MTTPLNNRRWRLVRRPEGDIAAGDLEFTTAPVPALAAGEVLVRNVYLSLDPTHRIWMSDRDQYLPPVEIGAVMRGGGIGVVEDTRSERFARGDIVSVGLGGWEDYTVASERQLGRVRRLDGVPLTAHLSVLGSTGLTAWYGMVDIGQPKAGETVVVSAAAGAVGSVAGQLARIAGCRVIGVTGGQAKCDWITGTLGFDAALDYKAGDLKAALKEICPEGVDVYFDNTGGAPLDAALARMNVGGRIACCGNVSQYDRGGAAGGPPGVPGLLVTKRIRMEGFIDTDHFARRHQAERALAGWLRDGRLKAPMDIVEGFERVPQALVDLLHGRNRGKMMIRIA